MKNISSLLFIVFFSAVVAACSSPPYVYKSGEFNRNTTDFGRPPTDISAVTICYSSHGSTVEQIKKLASDRCAEFGKTAIFDNQDYTTCPLSTPVAANYICVAPEPVGTPYKDGIYQYN